jgi:UDP-glucose 4-epimerase
MNVLEAVRKHTTKTFFIFSSTNKVYDGMENIKIEEMVGISQPIILTVLMKTLT